MGIKVSQKRWLAIVVAGGILAVVWVVGAVMAQEPSALTAPAEGSPTWTFTYQGQLNDNGQPADGYYDFSISTWNTSTLGIQVGDTYVYDDPGVLVEDGVFSINVPPGARDEVFNGEDRWIQVEVRPHGSGSYTTLSRQPITAVPYAWGLRPGTVVSGTASSPIFSAQATGGPAISGYSADGTGVYGATDGTEANDYGVQGASSNGVGVAGISVNRSGVYGTTEGTRDDGAGVHGYASDGNGVGVYGQVSASSSHSPFPDGAAVWGSSANELGVFGSSDNLVGVRGVSVGSTGVQGSSTDGAGVYGESANGYGVQGAGNNLAGVHGSSIVAAGVRGESTNGYGVQGVANTLAGVYGSSTNGSGVYGTSVYTYGVYGATEGTTINESGVYGVASGTANGVHGYQAESPNGLGVFGEHVGGGAAVSGYNLGTGNGVWGYSEDYHGVGAGTARTDNDYGVYTSDNLFSLNYHLAGALMQVVQNGDDEALERGDTVVIAGLSAATFEGVPILQARSAREANSTAVLGVVASTFSEEWLSDSASLDPTGATGLPEDIPLSTPGPVAPGEYMLVVVHGPCQVKAEAASAAIQPGDLLSTAGRTGYAAKAANVNLAGAWITPPGTVFGKALEPLNAGRDGLIYVFVTLQ